MFQRLIWLVLAVWTVWPFASVASPAVAAAPQGITLTGEARWGGSLAWSGAVEPGSRLVWAFVVQRGADGRMVGDQFDVRQQTTLHGSGQLTGAIWIDFLHPLAADLYVWVEWRRPDGETERESTRLLPVTHREVRVDFLLGEPSRWVNGIREQIDMAPMLDQDRIFVPIRHAAEPFGASFTWDGALQKATMYRGTTVIELTVGRSTALVNGAPVPIDPTNPLVTPQVLAGRVLIPMRFVSEQMALTVDWVGREGRVVIQTPA